MKSNKVHHILSLAFFVMMMACKKQELSWNSEWKAPLADGRLELSDLIDSRYLQVNDSGWYDLVFDTTIEVGMDTLISIQDTTMSLDYVVPVSVSVPPGVMLINEAQNQAGMLPEDFLLKELKLKSGVLHYRIVNRIGGPLNCRYNIQRATIQGEPLEINVEVSGGTASNPGMVEGDLNLDQAHFDLTGVTGFLVNDLSTKMEVRASSSATQNVSVFSGDKISIEVSFIDPQVSYARGYFGQQEINWNDQLSLGKDFPQGQIQLQKLKWDCQIQNWMGVDASIRWNQIQMTHTSQSALDLQAPGIGEELLLARAEDWQGAVNPQYINLHWDEQNSNILESAQYLGGNAQVNATFQLNPLGNVNGTNDFIYPEKMLLVQSHVQAPLTFNAKDLTAEEWLDIQWDSQVDWNGTLTFQAENAFPFEADVAIMHESQLLGIIHLAPGGWNQTMNQLDVESTTSVLTIHQNQWNGIKKNGGLRLRWVFNTAEFPSFVSVRPEQYAALKVIGDVTLQTTIE
jgi:hypothetical protein